MDRGFLERLGLELAETDGVLEAELELTGSQAFNPLTRQAINRVSFTVVGERLLFIGPPELVGAHPLNLAALSAGTRLEDLVVGTLNDHLYQLERRSNELTALGIAPRVEPATLQLTAELEVGPLRFLLGQNRAGQFRVARVEHGGREVPLSAHTTFDLGEYRDRKALADFLWALHAEAAGVPAGLASSSTPTPAPAAVREQALPFRDLVHAFGDGVLPPRSPLEVLAEVRVGDQYLRFAAARVQGQTFRGLLAGPAGKLWADRFELAEFGGVRALVARVLGVELEEVEVLLP